MEDTEMTSPPWFRFYSETLKDRKIERICRLSTLPKMAVVGAWSIVMAIANDSPIRGALLLTGKYPLSLEDLAQEFGCDLEIATELIEHFIDLEMLDLVDGVYHVTHWHRRQFTSDSSTERVRLFRERRKQPDGNTSGNDTETLPQRSSNAPDTDTDTDTEQKKSPAGAAQATPIAFAAWQIRLEQPKRGERKEGILREMFIALYPGRDAPDFSYIGRVAKIVGGHGRLAELLWQASTRPPTGDVLAYCLGIAKGGKGNGSAKNHTAVSRTGRPDGTAPPLSREDWIAAGGK
jgi:hypothetical protein